MSIGAKLVHAPAVVYPVSRSTSLSRVLLALWGLGVIPLFWVLFQALAPDSRAPIAIFSAAFCAGVLMVVAIFLWRFWLGQEPRQLRWDGADWFLLEPDGGEVIQAMLPGHVSVRLDLQRCLLVLWRGQSGRPTQWLWVDAKSDPLRWHLLRCALYSKTSGQGEQPQSDPLQRA